ncbi:MAG: protein kinase [Pirellulales bacterium]
MSDTKSSIASGTRTVDLTGRALGDYQLLRRLGSGGMADVYLAEQVSLQRQVAFKVLRAELAQDASSVERFRQEALAAAAFVHPNVVQIYEVNALEGVHYIAQEYVRGQSLGQLMARHGPPDLPWAMAIMRQVATALNLASDRGIIHRDIKPENILLSSDGRVKVADFGLARVAGANVNLTQVGITMGTPLYMSPEQVEGKPLDPRSDLYSLGVTCYHMLAGVTPFRGETALAVAVQHLNVEPARLDNLRPDLPPALCRIVHKLLAKKPDDRFANPRELLRELRAVATPDAVPNDAEELDGLADAFAGAVTGRHAATQRLDQLMKTQTLLMPSAKRRWGAWAVILAGLAAAFAVGGAAAWAGRERSLLADADASRTHVEKRATADAQFFFAPLVSPPELGYQAVLEHYPANEYFCHRARQELALIYLRRDDYANALRLFDQLATAVDVEFRAFGLAGQCVVLSLQGERQKSIDKLNEAAPLANSLDPQMARILTPVARSHRQALGLEQQAELNDWLEERFGEGEKQQP